MSRNQSANLFDLIAARAPHLDKVALETRDATALTYGELFKRSAQAANALVAKSKHHNHMHFLGHGMGLVSHEAPRLTATGPVPYDAYDATRPLETGMVVSVETTLMHPKRGFIKLEDTIAVTDTGYEIYGEGARGWNRGGVRR